MWAPLRFLSHRGFVRACQVVLGVLFCVAALAKLVDLSAFAQQVHNFRILPIWSENLVAMHLPWIELVAAVAMVAGIRPREASLVVTVLLAVFTVAVVAAMARGLDFECGCFGTADATRVGFSKLGQNLGMLVLGVLASTRPR